MRQAAILCSFALCAVAFVQPRCGINEQFYECGACDSTCLDDLTCNSICKRPGSCGCLPTYKRNRHGKCIPPEQCPKPWCGMNEEFYPCGACDKTCWNARPQCSEICRLYGGCGCKSGFVRDGNYDCVHYSKCPRGRWWTRRG
ncbi:hypothetical protein L596_013710 [Steinernema carpocapsae]|uniref:TIL domain-containing protein n=1 Tax=Steinernema carpocapsae TaxID=34508 RepID=A0A4U5P1N5_STECR|nr:hypothetical protein L596_013710 [Steinernema carpocapsae]